VQLAALNKTDKLIPLGRHARTERYLHSSQSSHSVTLTGSILTALPPWLVYRAGALQIVAPAVLPDVTPISVIKFRSVTVLASSLIVTELPRSRARVGGLEAARLAHCRVSQ
jgi:hypothetical protein